MRRQVGRSPLCYVPFMQTSLPAPLLAGTSCKQWKISRCGCSLRNSATERACVCLTLAASVAFLLRPDCCGYPRISTPNREAHFNILNLHFFSILFCFDRNSPATIQMYFVAGQRCGEFRERTSPGLRRGGVSAHQPLAQSNIYDGHKTSSDLHSAVRVKYPR